jgi:hypothetical protein
VVVNLFSADPDAVLKAFQGAFLETIFIGAILVGVSGDSPEDRLDDLIRVGASVSAAGLLLRDMLVNPERQPAPIDPPENGNHYYVTCFSREN